MIEKFRFYIKHSMNDLRVNGQRTLFAILCIAVGVAAIVSLQTLGVMIQDTLTGNLRETLKGDIQFDNNLRFVSEMSFQDEQGNERFRQEFRFEDFEDLVKQTEKRATESGLLEIAEGRTFFDQNTLYFGERGREILAEWAKANIPQPVKFAYEYQVVDITAVFTNFGVGTIIDSPRTNLRTTSVTPVMIDSRNYPIVGEIRSQDGTLLRDLFPTPNSIVLSENVARNLRAEVGDTIRLSGVDGEFTVTGIVPTEKEAGFTNFLAGIFGFYYIDISARPLLGIEERVQRVYMALENPDDELIAQIGEKLMKEYSFLNFTTTLEVAERNEFVSDLLDQLLTIMGLVALLLGSIGIVNTMQVVVRRRTLEVAVLKTIGLQANQVTTLFLVEAFIMGVIGSVLGVVLGWGLTFIIKGSAETLLGQTLPFRITPSPAITGLIVGALVTTVFGFLPTLSAGQVRPGIVLRPNDDIIPRTGLWRSLGALLVVIIVLSIIAAGILQNPGLAFGVVIGTFFMAGFFYLVLQLLLWITGKFFPALGWIDLRLALKAVLVGRRRGAFTLLALVVGVFSLSLVTLLADSASRAINQFVSTGLGGNVLIQTFGGGSVEKIEPILQQAEGVNSYTLTKLHSMELISVTKNDGTVLSKADIEQNIMNNGNSGTSLDFLLQQVTERDVTNNLPDVEFLAGNGRQLTVDDAQQPVIILPREQVIIDAGLSVGDKLTLRLSNKREITLTIVGLSEPPSIITQPPTPYVPSGSLGDAIPFSVGVILDINEDNIPELRSALSKIPGVFMIEARLLNVFVNAILGQLTAMPILVTALSLIVGGVVIANSVALATIERRKEIAIMKTVGVQRGRVLGMLLLENAIMGFIGGLLGVGLGLIGLAISLSQLPGASSIIPYGTAFLLMMLCVGIALVAAITTAWGASGEKPLNVLRYE
jgi:ABC-type antimicrobial peptide transport system permease subunit